MNMNILDVKIEEELLELTSIWDLYCGFQLVF
jgi:hypothetical protein